MNIKILKQMGIILGICLVAEMIVSCLPVAFPSSVAAILLLALLLGTRILKEKQIKETADFLLSNMALVFVPLAVGMIEDLDILKGQIAGFIIVVAVSLFITFIGTYMAARIVQKCIIRFVRKGGSENE